MVDGAAGRDANGNAGKERGRDASGNAAWNVTRNAANGVAGETGAKATVVARKDGRRVAARATVGKDSRTGGGAGTTKGRWQGYDCYIMRTSKPGEAVS